MKLDPPPDLVEIAEALDAMAKPHWGAASSSAVTACRSPHQDKKQSGWNTTASQEGRTNGKAWLRAARERLLRQRQGA